MTSQGQMISVVIPTHLNDPPFLREALDSVIAQTHTSWEAIVVADGVADVRELRRLTALDPRIRFVAGSRRGVARARNLGVEAARSDLLAFLDHDDLWAPDHLATLLAALDATPGAVAAAGGYDLVDGGGRQVLESRRLDGEITRQTVFSGGIRPSITSLLIPRKVLVDIGGLESRFDGADDLDLIHKLAWQGPFAVVDRQTVRYRWHGGNWSANPRAVARVGDRVLATHLRRAERTGDTEAVEALTGSRKAARRFYAGAAVRHGVGAARHGSPAKAVALVGWGVRFSPVGAAAVAGGIPRRLTGSST